MGILGSMMALYMIYLLIKWGLIIGAVIIGLWLVVAIIKGSANGWNGYADKDTYSTSTYYKPDTKPVVDISSKRLERKTTPKPSNISNTKLNYKPTPKPTPKSDSNNVYTLVRVRFQDGGKMYEYLSDNPNVNVGDTVYVDTRGGDKELKVETVTKSTEANLELPLKRYKTAYSSADKIDNGDHLVISGEITVTRMDDYTDDTDLSADEYTDDIDLSTVEDKEKSLLEIEEEERMLEPYVCPECGEPYDGILCDVCGHRNDEIGYEEEGEADQWFENMAMMAFFDAEDNKMKAEKEERESFLFGDYSDEFDEGEDW